MSLSRLSIRRPIGTMMIALSLLVLGGVAVFDLPVDFLPRIIYPRIIVIVGYPGVNPTVIEEEVTKVLERELATTDGIRKIYSTSSEGRAFVNLFFRFDRDIDLALQDTITKVNLARQSLPDDVDPPRVWKFDPAQLPILELSLSSKTMTGTALRTWADETLVRDLLLVPGVASVEAMGGQREEVQVLVDFPRLQQLGLTVNDVIERLDEENKEVSGGRIVARGSEYLTRTVGRLTTPEDIGNIIIHNSRGKKIYLKDFARVEDGGERQRVYAWVNNDEAIKVIVLKQPDANTVEVAEGVHQKIASLRAQGLFPTDTDMRVMLDQSWFIKNSIRDVSTAILIGGGLAICVVILFLGSLRRTFIIGLSIPIALVVTFFLMELTGLTLNIFSLGGLALGVGMLVDNSIVMLENISRHQQRHGNAVEAAEHGAKEVESALWASAGTNLAAILPFLFISGVAALLFREMVLTISFAMVVSLLVALTLVATLSAKLLTIPRSSRIDRFFPIRGFRRVIDSATALYARSLGGVLRFRYLVLAIILAGFAAVVPLFNQLETELLPPVDDHRASIFVRFPPGRSLAENVEAIRQINDATLDMPNTQSTFMVAGGRLYGRNIRTEATIGSVDVAVDPEVDTLDFVRRLDAKVRGLGLPDTRLFVMKSRVRGLHVANANHRRDISVSVRGEDLDTLDQIGKELIERIKTIPGVTNVDRNIEEAEPEFRVHVDRERASEFGLSVTEVGNTVRAAVDGVIATQLTRGNRQVDVRVRYEGAFIGSQSDIANLSLFPKTGEIIPLRHVALVGSGMGPASIEREDQSRVLQIVADIQGRPLGEVAEDIRAVARTVILPPGYGIIAGEEEAALRETNRTMALLTALAVFLVFVVMAVQYESLSNPLVIILTVPLALMGGVLGLYLTDTPIGATVLLGSIMLVGIVVNNAILLVEYIVQRRRDHGASKMDAIREAGRLRLRPILMTSLTTVIALIPLALGLGEGSEMMKPLGIVVATGLSFATFITLFMTPVLYAIVDDAASSLRRMVFGAEALESERRTLARAHVSSLRDEVGAPNGPAAGAGVPTGAPTAEIVREQPDR